MRSGLRTSRRLGRLIDEAQSLGRNLIVPLGTVARLVPDGGRVLELGCGQGLLIRPIASRVERVVGVDFDARKCEMARRALADLAHVEIVEGEAQGFLAAQPDGAFSTILVADTLSSMSDAVQDRVLAEAIRCLRPGGSLLLKIIDAQPAWKAAVSRAVSGLVYRVLHLSISDGQRFHYRPRGEYRRLMEAQGLRVEEHLLHEQPPHPIPHVVLVGRKGEQVQS